MTRKVSDRKTGAGFKRRARGFQRASETARRSLDAVAGKHGFAEADVLLRWAEIAGAAISGACRPVKVHYGANRTMGATLIVQTDSAHAPQVSHMGPVIVDRVNQFYGYRAINRLKVTQSTGLGAATGFADEQTAFEGPAAAPAEPEIERAAEMAGGIENDGLRDALTLMGANILARGREPDAK